MNVPRVRGQSALDLGLQTPELVNCQRLGAETVDYYFERFWALYPRRVAKKRAREAFGKAVETADLRTMSDGLKRWLAWWAWDCRPQFIPHPTTWLNQERWNDDTPPMVSSNEGLSALQRVKVRRAMRERHDALQPG